jgi:hypothetical protein
MNRSQIFIKKIVFNYNFNREKFANNKKKKNISDSIIIRKMHTNAEPPEHGPNWSLIAFISIVVWSVVKINNKRKSH